MAGYKIAIGNVEVVSVSDGWARFPVGELFPSVPAEAWRPYAHQLADDGNLHINLGSFLLRSDGKTLLVDTGLGQSPPEEWIAKSGELLKDLRARGIPREEIDMVVITHLHGDHVGWNVTWTRDAPQPTFPKARY